MHSLNDTLLTKTQARALTEISTKIKEKFKIKNIIIYGSIVRNEFEEESDIDLLIITSKLLPRRIRHRITDIVFDVNLEYETNFSTFVVDENSWDNGPYSILPIYNEISKEGVIYE